MCWQFLLFGFVLYLLSGCGTVVISHITVFHVLPENPPPTKYAFNLFKGQEGSLEYSAFKSLISTELSKYQYEEVPLGEASVVVAFNYTISEGREKLVSTPIRGQTGVASSYTTGTVNYNYGYGNQGTFSGYTTYTPTYGVTGYRSDSETVYTRRVRLQMFDKASLAKRKPKVLYDANVTSEGMYGHIAQVMPTIIKALFKEFPGENGSTREETLSIVK